ncbi:nucleolar and spindle-associated protein 1 [Narcine bancroftii]|uniref:nucleolar and spindle-associated protein 1 n=1 Tax=Narcine bancroftii TaxID=1343680 RepID=UPI003831CF65
MDLDGLRYAELQQLAKQCGLRANLKADILCKLLQEYFQKDSKENADVQATEENCNTSVLEINKDTCVTKRRGKRKLLNKSKEGEKENQNESEHQTTSEIEQPSMEGLPLSENSQNREGSDSKRKQRKRHAEFEILAETEDEKTRSVAEENAAATKHSSSEEATGTSKASKIPHYVGATKKTGLKAPIVGGKAGLKHVTPDWKKIHEANFNKMESIDLYVERRQKRLEVFGNSIKQVKMLAENSLPCKIFVTQTPGRNVKKSRNEPQKNMLPLLSPVQWATQKTPLSSLASQSKLPQTSVSKINFRFSEATKSNEKNRSAMKTPARMSSYTDISCTFGTEEVKINKTARPMKSKDQKDDKTMACAQTKVITPYKFSGNATPGTNKKFDLQASLSQPLRYKPHKGKLKPWVETKEVKVAQNNSQNTRSSAQNYKQPKLQTRENRRDKFMKQRKGIKSHMMAARRGLVME